MVYLLDNETLKADKIENVNNGDKKHLCIVNFDELHLIGKKLDLSANIIFECLREVDISKYENHDGFDFIVLNIPDDSDQRKKTQRVCIYFTDKLILFVCSNYEVVNDMLTDIKNNKIKNISIGKIIHLFFYKLTFDDAIVLGKIEQDIMELEEELILSKKKDLIDSLIIFRKKLLNLKRYYEQLLDISEEFEQNDNGLIDENEIRYFKILTNRVDRLYHGVLNLRDYVTQVREAYQAQIDIQLNIVMKTFTVMTSVFLPLTLIVGWYGMNLKMPEYGWNYGYLFVIAISVVVAVATLIYFKKKKWF